MLVAGLWFDKELETRNRLSEAGMADAEEKQEKGGSLMFAGLAVWVAGLLVLFYLPAGFRLGHQYIFALVLVLLAALGAGLMVCGWRMRRTE